MDLSLNSLAQSIRLDLKTVDAGFMSKLPELTAFLKNSGIKCVLIGIGAEKSEVFKVAALLNRDFDVFIEHGVDGIDGAAAGLAGSGLKNASILPVYHLEESAAAFKALLGKITALKLTNTVFVKSRNKEKIGKLTKARMKPIISAMGGGDYKIFWDCGLTLCDFRDEELGFFIQKGCMVNLYCPSLLTVDAGFNAYFCGNNGGGANYSTDLFKHNTIMDIVNDFGNFLKPYFSFGVYKKCSSCGNYTKNCSGGCKTVVMKSFIGS
ncbi:MAG: hypothetical protein ABII64_07870 [Elusimicrobiota bacterium]